MRTCPACGAATHAADPRCRRCAFTLHTGNSPAPAYVPDPRFGVLPTAVVPDADPFPAPDADPFAAPLIPATRPPDAPTAPPSGPGYPNLGPGPGYPNPAYPPPGYPAPAYPPPPGFAPPAFAPPGFPPPGFVHPGFAPPGFVHPGFAPGGVVAPAPDTRLQGPILKTALTIAVPFVFDAIYQLVFSRLDHAGKVGNETLGRYILAGTVMFYVAAGLVLLYWLHSTGRRLRWSVGKPAVGVLWGVLIGGALGLLGVAVNSAIAGHLSTDPRAIFLSSEGDPAHIVTTLLITAVAAPLVEETLFRGILMDWLRPKGAGAALAATAVLFAFWHFNVNELRYYAVMGVILGALYWKRGLVASMSAHAAFNGTLSVVAIMITLTPATQTTVGDLSFVKPQGWHLVRSIDRPTVREYQGPSGAVIDVASNPIAGGPMSAEVVLRDIQSGDYSLMSIGADTARAEIVTEPVGDVVRVPIRDRSSTGELDIVVTRTAVDQVVVLTAGSSRAQADFDSLMASLRVVG